MKPTVEEIRSYFPSLGDDMVFLENAGGSQVPACVPQAVADYFRNSYVQIGVPYPQSIRATETVTEAHRFANKFVNGEGTGKTIIGPCTTQLCHMLAGCYAETIQPGDEIVIAETGHEANAGPWADLEKNGATIKWWKVNQSFECPIEELEQLLSRRTRIVALPHVSNLLGHIVDVAEITELAHRYGARVVADGVAYAPHRAIDVKAWDVDYYVFSWYKVYGPHQASMFGKDEAWAEITGPNHFFIPNDLAYKFELGGPSHEACAAILAVRDYLSEVGGGSLRAAFDLFKELELPVQRRLMWYLLQRPDVRVIGPTSDGAGRVPTISFVHDRLRAEDIAAEVCKRGIAIRHGHMYAYRMCQALGLDMEQGVVRVSGVHYNTVQEIDRLTNALDEVFEADE